MKETIKEKQAPLVMIVDDKPANLDLLSDTLKQSGYRVRTAPSGRLALKAVHRDPPDLILLDIMMPEMDGLEVCSRLKNDENTEKIPVIFITALGQEHDEEKGFDLGAVDYITKPISIPIVRARVNTQLQLKLHRDHLEDLVSERTRELEQSLQEKDSLLKELHHRVKNNLQVISSMIGLQERFIINDKDRVLLKDINSRIHSMALIHEKLYQNDEFSMINFTEHITQLVNDLCLMYKAPGQDIEFIQKVEDIQLDINYAVPCSQIITELVTNSIKHAFTNGQKGEVTIDFRKNESGQYVLRIKDNGIGLPENFNFPGDDSLGLTLMTVLVEQLKGNFKVKREQGLEFIIDFKAEGNLSIVTGKKDL